MKKWVVNSLTILSFISFSSATLAGQTQAEVINENISQQASEPPSSFQNLLKPFIAKYTAYRSGNDVGDAQLQLTSLASQKFELSYQSSVSRFFLSDNRFENTIFSSNINGLVPHNYEYKRTGTGPNKSLSLEFDASQQKIIIDEKKSLDWHGEFDNQLFRLDLQQKLAQGERKAHYNFINYRGQKREYELEVVATENLSMPYGSINAIKVKINRISSSRVTYAWFAPALNFNLVRLQQFKDDKEQGDMQLSSFSYL